MPENLFWYNTKYFYYSNDEFRYWVLEYCASKSSSKPQSAWNKARYAALMVH